jgi:hypothetical protein
MAHGHLSDKVQCFRHPFSTHGMLSHHKRMAFDRRQLTACPATIPEETT